MPIRCVPSKTMSPVSGRSCPHTQLNSVVFPAPFGPTRPTHSPGATSNVMLCTAWMPPKDLLTLRTERIGPASAMSVRGREGAGQILLGVPAREEQPLEPLGRTALLVLQDSFRVGGVGQRPEGE